MIYQNLILTDSVNAFIVSCRTILYQTDIGTRSNPNRFHSVGRALVSQFIKCLLHLLNFTGYLAVFSVASCEDTWSLFSRTEEEQLLLFALTEVDCPRLPTDSAITVTFSDSGQELPQMFLDLRTQKAIHWKSAVILHDDTLSKYGIEEILFISLFYFWNTQMFTVSFQIKHC